MTEYTITIIAATPDEAVLALEQASKAIADGCWCVPWTSDGDTNGYSMSSKSVEPDGGQCGL